MAGEVICWSTLKKGLNLKTYTIITVVKSKIGILGNEFVPKRRCLSIFITKKGIPKNKKIHENTCSTLPTCSSCFLSSSISRCSATTCCDNSSASSAFHHFEPPKFPFERVDSFHLPSFLPPKKSKISTAFNPFHPSGRHLTLVPERFHVSTGSPPGA